MRFIRLFSSIVRIFIPLPSVISTSAVTLREIPSAAPLPVAIALTIEIAPCIVALTLFFNPVHQIDQRALFSSPLAEHASQSKSQRTLHLVVKAFHIHIQY